MQVALVCNSTFGTDGISMFVLNNHKYFKHDGNRFHLVYSSIHGPEEVVDSYVRDFEKDGDKTVFIPKRNGVLSYARKLYHYLKDEEIDVLHVHGSSSAILLELVVAKIAGVKKTMAHAHSTSGNHVFIHKILRPLISLFANNLLACGDNAGQWMYGKRKHFMIIPNCIKTSQYKFDNTVRNEMRKEFGLDESEFVIGHVGTFTEVKNHSFLLEIMSVFKANNKKYKLILIGQGPLFCKIKEEAAILGLSNNVLFLGIRNDIPKLMMLMDVFCLPSNFEGFPIVAVEAQAAGLPFLFSANITKEICLTDLAKQLPIDSGVDMWVETIERVVCNRIERSNYADIIKKEGFDMERSVKMMEQLYAS